jgi:CBS domain-containing protein
MSTVEERDVRRIPAGQVMRHAVLGIVPDAALEVALRMMVEAGVRHLPVITGERCVGLLHESDVLWRLWSTTSAGRPPSGAVVRVPAPCVEVTDDVSTVARRMTESATDVVLVADGGRIVGIVTATDLVRLLADDDWTPSVTRMTG